VDFPLKHLDPTDFLAAVPSTTLKRYKEIKENSLNHLSNGTIEEKSEPNSLNGSYDEDDDDDDVVTPEDDDEDVVTNVVTMRQRAAAGQYRRKRQVSTSLQSHPILDDELQDFHRHQLKEGADALDVKYNLYSMVCHSGVLGGGHYVSYGRRGDKWFCQNDSACKEVREDQLDKSTAYMLFYERRDLNVDSYLPKTDHLEPPDARDLEELEQELEADFKKQCVVM